MEDDDFDPLDVLDEGPADMPDYFEEPLPLPLHRFVCPPTPSVECNETSMQPRDLVFVFFLKEDDWMKEQSSDIRAECEIDELFECLAPGSSKNGSESEWVVKQPTQGEIWRQGAAVFRGPTSCGRISFFLHWDRAAILATCTVHADSCYATAPLVGGCSEDSLVAWLGDALAYKSASDHLKFLPPGCYHQRRR